MHFINLQLHVEGTQADSAIGRFTANIKEAVKASNGISVSNKKNQQTGREFFGGHIKSMGQMALGFAGVGSAIAGIATASRLVLAEFENIKETQAGIANSNLSFDQALAKAIDNSKGIFTANEVRSESLGLAASAGITPTIAANIIGSTTTSTGVTNKREARLALSSAKAATIYAPYLDTSSLEDFAGITASTAKRFGVSPEAAIGFSESGRAQSNVRDLGAYASNVAPVVNNLTEFGATPREASALMAMMTQKMDDSTGEMSGTASINLLKELRSRFGDQKSFQREDGSFNPIKAMAAIQQSEEAQRRFFKGGEFFGEKFGKASLGKGKAIPTIEGLLRSKDSHQARQMSDSFYAIDDFTAGERGFAKSVRDKRSVTPIEQARRILQSETGIAQANDPTGISAVIREELPKFEKVLGTGALAQKFNSITRELSSGFGTSPGAAIDAAMEQLAAEAAKLRRGREKNPAYVDSLSGLAMSFLGEGSVRSPVTQREAEQAQSIDRLVESLERIQSLVDIRVQVNNRPAEKADVRTPPSDRPSQALLN